MDTAVKFEAWRESIKRTIPRESMVYKFIIIVGGLVTFAFCLSLGIFQMKQWGNVLTIQNNFNNTSIWNNTLYENATYYDI